MIACRGPVWRRTTSATRRVVRRRYRPDQVQLCDRNWLCAAARCDLARASSLCAALFAAFALASALLALPFALLPLALLSAACLAATFCFAAASLRFASSTLACAASARCSAERQRGSVLPPPPRPPCGSLRAAWVACGPSAALDAPSGAATAAINKMTSSAVTLRNLRCMHASSLRMRDGAIVCERGSGRAAWSGTYGTRRRRPVRAGGPDRRSGHAGC